MRAARRRCAPPCSAAARRPASWPRLRCCAHTAAAGPRQRAAGPATSASAAARGAAPSLTTVAVGISGGVDSAVAAHILVEQGYRVVGLHVRSWDELDETGQCSGEADRRDAQHVCDTLGIPLHDV